MSTREQRAAARRRTWAAEVVPAGAPKRPLHADSSPEERIAAMLRLSDAAWKASGRPMPEPIPRSQWPSEVFLIRRD